MTGMVDELGAAMLPVRIKASRSEPAVDLDVWVDTGFTGDLVMPTMKVAELGLPIGTITEAILADGSLIQLDTYKCLIEWFGKWKQVVVVANEGEVPLLGVGLLMDHDLHVDYRAKTMIVG
jgi:clan AA aspartic protease